MSVSLTARVPALRIGLTHNSTQRCVLDEQRETHVYKVPKKYRGWRNELELEQFRMFPQGVISESDSQKGRVNQGIKSPGFQKE